LDVLSDADSLTLSFFSENHLIIGCNWRNSPLCASTSLIARLNARAAVAIFTTNFKEWKMPKLKTKSGVKKRFKLTATGKVKHGAVGKRHRLMSHNAKYIRQHRGMDVASDASARTVKLWAPYGL
jgi:large subunit ribosomal protein L35